MSKKIQVRILIIATMVAIVCACLVAYAFASEDEYILPVSEAPYRVDVKNGHTYYIAAYGMKSDGTLRIEVPVSGLAADDIKLLNSKREVIKDVAIQLIEIPYGRWRLYDRITGNEIKYGG